MSASTEVQRTLVKSPPELWAELSDPSALARHLSELGEVRITATQPERAVDWEATAGDGSKASGRVQISPTAWGTRVTFTATQAPAAPAAPPAPVTAAAPAEPEQTEPTAPAEPEPVAPATQADEPALAEARAAAPPADSAALAEGDPDDLPDEDEPIEDPLEDDDGLDDPYSDDDQFEDDELDDGDEVLVRGDLAIAGAHEPSRSDAFGAEREPPPEPRRGLLARLLGLGRRAVAPPPEPVSLEPPAYQPYEEIADQLPPPELPSAVAIAEQATQTYESVGAKPPAGGALVEPRASEVAALDAATLRRAHAAEHPAADEDRAPTSRAPVETADVASELRDVEQAAVEQTAAEHVQAVLTSALDSLGSAHHRPFSRA